MQGVPGVPDISTSAPRLSKRVSRVPKVPRLPKVPDFLTCVYNESQLCSDCGEQLYELPELQMSSSSSESAFCSFYTHM